MGKRKIVVGSRDTKLAVMQTELVMQEIRNYNPELELEIVTLKTTGDRILNQTVDKLTGKGEFIKELEQALIEARIDIAIHSLKDMPMEGKEELPIVALSKRGDARDALILPEGETLETMDRENWGKKIGSSSSRRKLQMEKLYPGVHTTPVRGNIITRLAKLDQGDYTGLILAAAGLQRVGLARRISKYFTIEEMVPAAGQGILAVQARKDLEISFFKGVHNRDTAYCAAAERSFVQELEGGCSSPIAAHAIVRGNEMKLVGLYYNEGTGEHCVGTIVGEVRKAKQLGESLANRVRGAIG